MKECIILAGGFGTRLQSVVNDVPKCMAEVAGHPFLEYLYQYLAKENFNHIILSLGYKSEIVIDWLELSPYKAISSYVIEKEPLGTGGAIKLAMSKMKTDKVCVINGDTFFDINTDKLYRAHDAKKADITIALKSMENFDRYGSVNLNADNKITQFNEKKHCDKGNINGGVYLINKQLIDYLNLPNKFSFEKEVLESRTNEIAIYGHIEDSYFIDIGIPSDYSKANIDFRELFPK